MEGTIQKRRIYFQPQASIFYNFSELSAKLNRKIVYVNVFNLSQSILNKINTSNAYILKESRAYSFITILNHYHMRGGPIFRIMKERKCT